MATVVGTGPRPAAARPAPAPRRLQPLPDLPTWPFLMLFFGFPVWWVLGVGSFAVVLFAVPMLLAMVLRGGIHVPRHLWIWLVFLAFMTVSVIQIDSALRVVGFAMRAGNYVGATIAFVYLYNLPRERLSTARIVQALLAFWVFMIVGGYLGMLFPDSGVTTPLSRVLPASVLANDLVQELTLPRFAEVQNPWGAAQPFVRPSAPFPYTNGWGSAYALLLPVVLYAVERAGRGRTRAWLLLLLASSTVPAAATLNRGMFLAVGVALAYASVRLALRGHGKPLLGVLTVLGIGIVGGAALGVHQRIAERLSVSGSNVTRLELYKEAVLRTLDSPILGYGAPRPSEVVNISVGTQGQVWNVMFSFGFLALFAYVGWFWYLAWRSRHSRRSALWLHVCLVVAAFTIFYYGYDGMQTMIVMTVAALLERELRGSASVTAPEHRTSASVGAAPVGLPARAAGPA